MLKSAPVAKANLVLAQSKINLIAPAIKAANIKINVNGNNNCVGEKISKISKNGCISAYEKTFSGEVNAPRKGSTAPKLKTSANEVANIRINKKTNCFFLRKEI
jgi:hypothetical protein